MTNTWSITQGSITVTLPSAPKICDDANPPKIDEFGVDGAGTVLISRFNQARKLKLQGSIWVHGQNNAYLESTYLAPLRAMSRLQVTITDPDGQYTGNWLMSEPDFHREAEGAEVRYTYSIEFLLASANVVLSGSGGENPTPPSTSVEGNYSAWTETAHSPITLSSTPPAILFNEDKLIYYTDNAFQVYLYDIGSGTNTPMTAGLITSSVRMNGTRSVLGKYVLMIPNSNENARAIFKNFAIAQTLPAPTGYSIFTSMISDDGKYVALVFHPQGVASYTIHIYKGS